MLWVISTSMNRMAVVSVVSKSGHIVFSKYTSTGDGILTSLKMIEVMLAKKKPMSELAAPMKNLSAGAGECSCNG